MKKFLLLSCSCILGFSLPNSFASTQDVNKPPPGVYCTKIGVDTFSSPYSGSAKFNYVLRLVIHKDSDIAGFETSSSDYKQHNWTAWTKGGKRKFKMTYYVLRGVTHMDFGNKGQGSYDPKTKTITVKMPQYTDSYVYSPKKPTCGADNPYN